MWVGIGAAVGAARRDNMEKVSLSDNLISDSSFFWAFNNFWSSANVASLW